MMDESRDAIHIKFIDQCVFDNGHEHGNTDIRTYTLFLFKEKK